MKGKKQSCSIKFWKVYLIQTSFNTVHFFTYECRRELYSHRFTKGQKAVVKLKLISFIEVVRRF